MSEPSNAQPATAAPAQGERPAPTAALRIDHPHPPEGAAPAAEASRQSAFPARSIAVQAAAGIDVRLISPLEAAAEHEPPESEPCSLQTGQIAAHLREQHADLDRREQRLHGQLAQLDQ